MGTKGICLLVVNDDLACRNIVAEMLQSCTYEVLHVGRDLETLSAVCERRDAINLVLTNLHRIQAQGSNDILHHIQKRLNLPTFLMSPDDEKIELKGQESSFAAYFLSSLNINEVDNLWEFASITAIEEAKYAGTKEVEGSGQMASTSQNINVEATTSRENTPSNNGDQPLMHRKRKRKKIKENSEQSEARKDGEKGEKKHRMIWTDELHKRFLEAMEIILPEKPVPKRIVEVMNMPWLRREHVASHLQKYRILLKKSEENSGASKYGMNLTDHVGEPSIPSWHSSSNFNSLQRNPNVKHYPCGDGKGPFHQGPFGIKSMAASSNSHPYSINSRLSSSSTLSRLRPSNMLASNINQGTLQQLSNPNLSSSTWALISQKKNCLAYANSQGNDWRWRLLQRQLKYGPRNIVNSGFRVYGDQTKNLPFSVQGSRSASTDATVAESFKSDKSFMGFRLTDDGKSLEFGGTSASVSIEIRTEISCSVKNSGIENQRLDNQLQPIPRTNNFQVPPDADLAQNGQYQNQGSGDNYPSNSFGCISQLVSCMEKTAINSPSLPFDPCTSQQHYTSPQDLCTTPGNEEAIHWPSIPTNINWSTLLQQQTFLPHSESPAYWDSSIQSSLLPESIEQQSSLPPLCAPENGYSAQYPTTTLSSILDDLPQINSMPPSGNEIVVHSSSILSAPQQESNVPLVGTSRNDAPMPEPLTSIQQNPQQESSIPSILDEVLNSSWPDGNFSALMNETETSCPQLFWDGDFDQDTFFNQY